MVLAICLPFHHVPSNIELLDARGAGASHEIQVKSYIKSTMLMLFSIFKASLAKKEASKVIQVSLRATATVSHNYEASARLKTQLPTYLPSTYGEICKSRRTIPCKVSVL